MKRLLLSALVTLLSSMPPLAAGQEVHAPFDFMVMGCMPYDAAGGFASFKHLIAAVNAERPAFTVHVGDTKSGASLCSDETLREIHAHFMQFEGPLIYSVGDNEWTDCHRESAGGYDPIERLAHLRALFFPEEKSLGQAPLPLVTQRSDPAHAKFVENTRWEQGGVIFAGLHVTGSNNNLNPENEAAAAEFRERDAANAVWLRETFAEAQEKGARAVVLFIQANPFAAGGPTPDTSRGEGYTGFINLLREETVKFGKPVLLCHADTHYFRVDKPLLDPATRRTIENFTRLETFGSSNIHLVRVTVDPDAPTIFSFREHLVPENLRTAQP